MSLRLAFARTDCPPYDTLCTYGVKQLMSGIFSCPIRRTEPIGFDRPEILCLSTAAAYRAAGFGRRSKQYPGGTEAALPPEYSRTGPLLIHNVQTPKKSGQLLMSRVYLKTPNAPGQRSFSRCATPFFLEIRQYSCEKMSCSAQKILAAGHIWSFQIHPRFFQCNVLMPSPMFCSFG